MNKDFTTSITVSQSPAEVYEAINNARAWWQGNFLGSTNELDHEFDYEVPGVHYSKQRVVELVPPAKIVWLVTESNLSFVTQNNEWTGTKLQFEIIPDGSHTKVVFSHLGLVPKFECYGACSGAWEALIQQSLYSYITTGKGVTIF